MKRSASFRIPATPVPSRERKRAVACGSILALALVLSSAPLLAQWGGELRFCLRSDPKTFDPLQVADDASETIRYLTGGVLIRVNRLTQQLQPDLAESWQLSDGGKTISFKLRQPVAFSDGTPFSSEDVAFTVQRMMDPKLLSPTGDSFRSASGAVRTEVNGPARIKIVFPAPVAGMERLFDQMAILSSRSPAREKAILGPFTVAEVRAGSYVLLHRNRNYWKKDPSGRRLPFLDSVRLDIQQNRDLELLRFRRGEIHLIGGLDADIFEQLAAGAPASAIDAGPSQQSEMVWFNQIRTAPIPAYKKSWFQSKNFRRSISEAIQREDICRLVYRGHARPAAGPFSASNKFWFNARLAPHPYDPKNALKVLQGDGFHLARGQLLDRDGNAVEFSLITNSGNKSRARIAALMQQDLAKLGIKLNVTALDFPSLIERIAKNYNYEACLLGLTNVDLDPNGQMNVWLSSAGNHQWNPNQKSPETPWEAEIDMLMQTQASAMNPIRRKAAFDRVQEIVWGQAPFLYLVNTNTLAAVSPLLRNAKAVTLTPNVYWNADTLHFGTQISRNRE